MRKFFWIYLSLLVVSHLVTPFACSSTGDWNGVARTESVVVNTDDGEALRLSYATAGDGRSVLFIHGSPGHATDFRLLFPALSKSYRLIAVDLPGVGDSRSDVQNFGPKRLAKYLIALMDRLHVDTVDVVGYSFGGGVAIRLAHDFPHRVRSVTLLSSIGVQEMEGSGDYDFEHLKYRVGYPFIVWLPELIPHFGLLGTYGYRRAFIRNFIDMDQREFRGILSAMKQPVLILHGTDDPLVPYGAAKLHHELIERSILKTFPGRSHFMPFVADDAKRLSDALSLFLHGLDTGQTEIESDPPFVEPEVPLPVALDVVNGSPWRAIGVIIVSTFVSEDLTCIAAGLMSRVGKLDLVVALFGCWIGIFLGDLLLWLSGRLMSGPFKRIAFFSRRFPPERFLRWEQWLKRNGWSVILLSRFVPGTRFFTYTGAGFVGGGAGFFALRALFAGFLWTPFPVLFAFFVGAPLLETFDTFVANGWIALALTAAALYVLIRCGAMVATTRGRETIRVRFYRITHQEFWPTWLRYLPVGFYILFLAFRYRSLRILSCVNPGIVHGGIVGESKGEILAKLPEHTIIPYFLIERHATQSDDEFVESARTEYFRKKDELDFRYPLIFKPDVSERGIALRLVRSDDEAVHYITSLCDSFLVQHYDPGPYEAGIFYYRMPGESNGKIGSITDKVFPEVIGDGIHTVRELVLRDQRFRYQSDLFLERFADGADRIPAAKERFALSISGNHGQGTLFRNGDHLITPELAAAVERIVDSFPGFYLGRFDIRYGSPEAFMNGEAFSIVELNGTTGEPTNMYDPEISILSMYAILFGYVKLLFEIGDLNHKNGAIKSSYRELFSLYLHYRRRIKRRNAMRVSD